MKNNFNKSLFKIITFWIVGFIGLTGVLTTSIRYIIKLLISIKIIHNNKYFDDIVIYLIIFILIILLNKHWIKQKVYFKSDISFHNQFFIDIFIIICFLLIFYDTPSLLSLTSKHSSYLNLVYSIEAGVIEEYTFRGIILIYLLKTLLIKYKNKAWLCVISAVIISSLMFSITHFINITHQELYYTFIQASVAFGMGILLAVIYLRTRSLLWSIFLHFSYDFSSFFIGNFVTYADNTYDTYRLIIYTILIGLITMFIFLRPDKIENVVKSFLK